MSLAGNFVLFVSPRGGRARNDYVGKVKIVEKEFSYFPLAIITDRRSRGVFKARCDRLAVNSRRQADYAWSCLAFVVMALDRGLIAANAPREEWRSSSKQHRDHDQGQSDAREPRPASHGLPST
jgi:hypothetical protein